MSYLPVKSHVVEDTCQELKIWLLLPDFQHSRPKKVEITDC